MTYKISEWLNEQFLWKLGPNKVKKEKKTDRYTKALFLDPNEIYTGLLSGCIIMYYKNFYKILLKIL